MTDARSSRTFALVLIGLALFVSLLPIALTILNALKTTTEINSSPFALPATLQWENFASAWRNAALGASLLHSSQTA